MLFSPSRISFLVCACALVAAALLVIPTIANAQSEPPPVLASAPARLQNCTRVQGTVFEDINRDGVQNPGEKGLSGIKVQAKNVRYKITKNRTTNSNGRFSVPKLKSGRVIVTLSVPANHQATTPKRVRVTLPACKQVTFGLAAAPAATPTAKPKRTKTPSPTQTPEPTVEGSPTNTPEAQTITGTAYYVDCWAGSDQNSGKSPSSAWKTLTRANKATLLPGDGLLLKRGCTWTGSLEAKWTGTATSPITISAYGGGDLPIIQNAGNYASHVRVSGSYQVIEFLFLKKTNPNRDPNCNNQSYGWYWGFGFANGSSYNTVRYSKATGMTAGVYLNDNAHHNKILNNELYANNVMGVLDPAPSNDVGAWGINLHGTDNEIAYNYLHDNLASCSYDYGFEGSAIELFKAQRNKIHHNKSINDKVFSELGGDSTRKSADNTFAFNLYTSNKKGAEFLVVTGYGDTKFGPVLRTKMYNNTIHLTHATSEGVICSRGCSPEILEMRNNIIWAEWKVAFADGPFAESNNVFWNSAGKPLVQFQNFTMSSTDIMANPLFVDRLAWNFHLKSNSPAKDRGSSIPKHAGYLTDYDGISIWVGAAADAGIFEYH